MRRSRSRKRAVERRARQKRRQERRLGDRRGPSAALRALTSSALALPGLADRVFAESAPVDYRADYRYSRYSEDAISRKHVAPGTERDRYEIDIHQFSFEAPIGERWDLGVELAHETMSGATPWYINPPDPGDNDPVQVMTGATIDEARTDALVTGSRYLERGKVSAGAGVSFENDYLAFNGNLGGERSFNEKNTTVSLGIGASIDRITPVDTREFPDRPDREEKQSYSVSAGVSQVLTRSAAIQSSLKYQHARGFLSDPYKRSFVVNAALPDARPDVRHQVTWLTRYRQHFSRIDGTLHLDYQFYFDDWDIRSHALELAWYQTFFDRMRVVPSVRYYTQSQADFYAPYYVTARSDGLRSSDYRLSPYGAVSGKIKLETRFQTWQLVWDANVAWERYVSDADFAVESVDVENPGLVSYNVFSIGLTAHF